MAVIATDNFNRANETPLSGGGNWSPSFADANWNLSSNVAVPTNVTTSDSVMHYTAGSWPNDHYSKGNLTVSGTGGGDQGVGLTVRGTTAATTYYRAVADHGATNNVGITKMVSGVYTNLALVTSSWTDGATWELDVQGTSLTFKRAGSTILTATDSAIVSGKPGIVLSTHVTSASLDNWEGGNFSSGGSVSLSDSTALSESFLKKVNKLFAEAMAMAEARSLTVVKRMAESTAMTEARVLTVGKKLVESTSFSESVSATKVIVKSVAESTALAEARVLQVLKQTGDALSMTEALTKFIKKLTAESTALSESVQTAVNPSAPAPSIGVIVGCTHCTHVTSCT